MISWLFSRRFLIEADSDLLDLNLSLYDFKSFRRKILNNSPYKKNNQFRKLFSPSCFINYSEKYNIYMSNDLSLPSNQISLIGRVNSKLISMYMNNGFEILSNDLPLSKYVITKLNFQNDQYKFQNVTKLQTKIAINANSYAFCHEKAIIENIRYIKHLLIPILSIIIISAWIVRNIPLKYIYSGTNEFTIFYICKCCRLLTPFSHNIPKYVKKALEKYLVEFNGDTAFHEIYLNRNRESYKVIIQKMSHGIIQCSLLHMNHECGDSDFQATEGGSVCSVDGDDLRYPIEAKIQCKAGKPPSIIYHVSVHNEPTEVRIMSNFVNDIPIGRQSNEISNLLSIHRSLLLQGLSTSPSISTFISFLNMVGKKLGLSCLSLFICEDDERATIYSQCEDDTIKPYIEKFSQEFFENKHRQGEIFKYDIGNYRLGVHSLIIQNCRYMVILALKSSTYILRNVEYFIHAIFSILVTHNHKKLSRFVSHRTIGKAPNLWNSEIACAEYVNNQYSWSLGSIYNKPATKEVIDEIYFRVQSAFELNLNKMINFIVPVWQTSGSRSILEVYAISTICKMRDIPVLTFIVRDVTELFGKGLYDNHFLTSSLLGAVMFGLQRVNGKNLELEVRPTAERFLGEMPPISFSTLTWIADSKLLSKFATEEKKSINLIKKSGEMIAAATVPLSGNDDFMFYPLPELSSAFSNVMISNGRIDDAKNDVRVSFFDLLMDTCLDIRGQLKKRRISELNIPELAECPRIRQHIQLLAGSLYYNDIDQFYSCVQDSFKYGKSSCLIHLHEKAVIRPFLVNSQHRNDILTIVMMSLEEENYIVNHGSVVLCAMDAQPTTHHIFPWRFQFIETADCIYSTTPGGAYPTMFSKSSMVHMVIPDQRRHLVAQLESGNVNLLILIKYDRARWYILKGTRVGEEIHGMNVLAPYGSVPYLLRPEKVSKLANTLLKSFQKMSEKIEVDLSSLNETVNNLKDVEIDFSSFY